MFTPVMDSYPPPLVDSNPPFYPPPNGATDGGQPGSYNPFPGYRNNAQPQPSSSQWPMQSTPYPSVPWPLSSPSSAPAWGTTPYYPPAGAPLYAPQPQPAANGGWTSAYTPAGNGTGYPSGPAGPSYHPPTPYFTGQPPPATPYPGPSGPSTPFEPVSFTANPNGWYDGPQSAGPTMGGAQYVRVKKPKRRGSKYRRDDHYQYDPYDDNDDEAMTNTGAGGLGYSMSMKRTHSQGNPKRRASLQRSASWGNGAQGGYAYGQGAGGGGGYMQDMTGTPGYARGDLWDENNLARRPRDWRADFTGREGIAGYLPQMLPSMLKPKTDVREWTDPERREIHPLLLYKPTYPPIEYDLRNACSPFDPANVTFATLDRPHNDIDLAQLAVQPSSGFLRLLHPRLPWYIDVHASHPNGVTVFDVFKALTVQLGTPIHGRHFWNEALSVGDRAAVSRAFQERCKGRLELVPRGVLQVDFMGERCVFQGLARGARGMWEIKATKP